MSSMFKKKGGPAFKPKIPAARRPAAPAPSQPPKPSPASVPPPVSDESRSQQTSQETSESSSPKETVTAPVEPKPQDSHHDGQPPTPPSTNPEPAKPYDAATSQKASQEKSPEESQQVAESQDVVTRTEKVVAPVATPKPAAVVVTESATEQIQPRSKQQQDQLPSTGEHFSQPHVPQTSDSESVASPVLQTPTPDDSESPSGTEPSTTSSPPAGDSNESQPAPSTEQNIPKPTRKTRARKQTTQETQDENGTEGAPPKKRQRKTAEDGATPKQPRKRKAPAQSGTNTPKNRKARSLTPEDSESQLVDLQKLKMADLTKDLHIGKKFSRHDELRERERRARMKSKLGTNEERDSSATPDAGGQIDKTGSPAASPAPSAPAPAAPSGPQFRIVDGQIVIDQSSLSVDRHARAAAAAGDMETVEENDFTRLITSNSFMNTSKLKGPNIWTEEETELFYRGLCMFGTDFEMISKMFPGKQRRNVKLKYNREERHCPRRITAALVGEKTVKININEYKAFTGSEFEPVDAIEAEQRKIQEEYEAEEKRRADEQAEVMRKRREELFKDDEDGDAKKKKKKKKQTVIYGLNGEPIVQEE